MRYNRFHKNTGFLTPTTYTQELSEYIAKLKYEDLPAEVVEKAKAILVNTVGAALAGRSTKAAQDALRIAAQANGGFGGSVSVWGSGEKLSAVNAAYVLGTMADALDWEDAAWAGHPASAAVAAAWAAAQEKHKSGKELITAIVAAYEVYNRVAMHIFPSRERRLAKGIGEASWQIFAGIVPAAKLYGLDERKINQALGMGCESSPLPTTYHSVTKSNSKYHEYGYRAKDGILISKCVEKGINNNRDALDDARCYLNGMCGVPLGKQPPAGETDLTWLNRGLGEEYMILNTALKRWPANLLAQAAANALDALVKEYGFAAGQVEEIQVASAVEDMMALPAENTSMCAQYSIPYTLAAVLTTAPGAKWFSEEMMGDAATMELAGRVKAVGETIHSVDAFEKIRLDGNFTSEVTVVLKDGTKYTAQGAADAGLSLEAAADLFLLQAAQTLSAQQAEAAVRALSDIDSCEDIAALAEVLA